MRPRHVIGPIRRFRRMLVSNVFLVDGGAGDRFLIDTGHRVERRALLAGLRHAGFLPRELTGVLLTHRHSDHAGNASFLRERFGVRIFAHREDAEVLEGRREGPPIVNRSGNRVAWAFGEIENRTSIRVTVDRALEAGDIVGSVEVHHVPGHTAGSVFYRHGGTSSLLSGDTLLAAVPPLAVVQRMCLPSPDYTSDPEQALESLRRFHAAGVRYDNLLSGHGRPILGDAQPRAEALLRDAAAPQAAPRGG